ncbi:Calmodulin [Hexamita inflata]|uniref:Calmodulin n=1 Tax=Hexamita inflata TaxID=28002 RepID=A0ABP1IZH2_9EUKA
MGCSPSKVKPVISTAEIDLTQKDIDEMFKQLDVNGDTSISAAEVHSLVTSFGVTVNLKTIQILIYCADKSGDGTIQKKEMKHLVELILNIEKMQEEFSKAVDSDNENDVKIEEFEHMKNKLGWDIEVPKKNLNRIEFQELVMKYIQE